MGDLSPGVRPESDRLHGNPGGPADLGIGILFAQVTGLEQEITLAGLPPVERWPLDGLGVASG